MKKINWLYQCVVIFIYLASPNVFALEIKNFVSGYACTDGETFGWICHQSKDIYVTGQGSCIWNDEEKPCTWYGFEFDYSGNKNNESVECVYEMSKPVNEGNPDGVLEEDLNSGSFSLSLDEEGHFYNPQYFVLVAKDKSEALIKSKTVCSVNREFLFEFGFDIHFPVDVIK